MVIVSRGLAVLLVCTGLFAACSRKQPPEPTNWFKVDSSTAGIITGKVMFVGKQPPDKTVDMDQDLQCKQLHQSAVVDDSVVADSKGMLANVFVYLKQGLEDKKFAPPPEPVVIDQKGCWFGPRVLGIQVGQTLKVTNSDPLTHNIHPLAQINREWNQSQPPEAEPFTRRFSQPEVMVRVKCNIHNWMHSWIGVVAHPYFAVTGTDGSFQLRNVPPGNYTIEAWQEVLGTQQQPIVLASAGKSDIVFTFKGE